MRPMHESHSHLMRPIHESHPHPMKTHAFQVSQMTIGIEWDCPIPFGALI